MSSLLAIKKKHPNANSQQFPRYLTQNPEFLIQTESKEFIKVRDIQGYEQQQIKDKIRESSQTIAELNTNKSRQSYLKAIIHQESGSAKQKFVKTETGTQSPILLGSEQRSPIHKGNGRFLKAVQIQQISSLQNIQGNGKFVSGLKNLNNATPKILGIQKQMAWNLTSKSGEITHLQTQAKDFDEQKRVAICYIDKKYSAISEIDPQFRSTFNSSKKSQFLGGIYQQTESTAASSKQDSPMIAIISQPTFDKLTSNYSTNMNNMNMRRCSSTQSMRNEDKYIDLQSQVGQQLQKYSKKANKQLGLAAIDKSILDHYSRVNSRLSISSYGIQQQIDSMREALVRYEQQLLKRKQEQQEEQIIRERMEQQAQLENQQQLQSYLQGMQNAIGKRQESRMNNPSLLYPNLSQKGNSFLDNKSSVTRQSFIQMVKEQPDTPVYISPAIRERFYKSENGKPFMQINAQQEIKSKVAIRYV